MARRSTVSLAVVAVAVFAAALHPSEAQQCTVDGCSRCVKGNPKQCDKCRAGYAPNGFGACGCAAGYASTADASVTKTTLPLACAQQGGPAPADPSVKPCKCQKCPKGSVSPGGPTSIAQCYAEPASPVPNPPTAALSVPLSYATSNARYVVNLQFGSNSQLSSLVLDTGSGSAYTHTYNPATSTTSSNTSLSGILGYGSSPATVSFWGDSVLVQGTKVQGLSTANASSLSMPKWNYIGDAGFNATCVPPACISGLVGLAPSGGLTGGMGNASEPTMVGGAACFPAGPNGALMPCNNTPPLFQALLANNSLPQMFSLWLNPPSPSTGANLNGDSQLLLGGYDPSLLPSAQFVVTPLQPNRWRNDFVNGSNNYVFWQFNPLSIDLEYANGSTTNLCDSKGNIAGPNACTAIADTGYADVVVNNAPARNLLTAATTPGAPVCGARLIVKLPTNQAGTAGQTIAFNLTVGGTTSCGNAINGFGTPFGSPPTKLEPYLPPNWWVFGQPLLQQMYTVFDFTLFNGAGGLRFAPRQPPKFSVVTVALLASNEVGKVWPANIGLTNHQLVVGNSNGQPLNQTIDTGSGVLIKRCGGGPGCPSPNKTMTKEMFIPAPGSNWKGCLGGLDCGYTVGLDGPKPADVFDGYLVVSTNGGPPTCNFTTILEPSGSQSTGPIMQDTILLYNAKPNAAQAGTKPVVTINDGLVGCHWHGDTFNSTTMQACNIIDGYRIPCGNDGSEAGHDRDTGSIPTMAYNSGAVSYDAFAICQFDQAVSSNVCNINKLGTSYMVYGNAIPANPNVTLATVPLLSQQQLSSYVQDKLVDWSLYNQSRMLTRYLAQVSSIQVGDGQPITYPQGDGVVNLDTGAFAALQVGPVAYNAWLNKVYSNLASLNGTGGFAIVPCPRPTNATVGPICSNSTNVNPDLGTYCLMINVPKQKNAKEQAAKAQAAAALLAQVFPGMTATFANGATATLTTAVPAYKCDNTAVAYCSYPSPSNKGIPTHLWWANTFFNDRFVQFDRQQNVVRFSQQGAGACASGFIGVA